MSEVVTEGKWEIFSFLDCYISKVITSVNWDAPAALVFS